MEEAAFCSFNYLAPQILYSFVARSIDMNVIDLLTSVRHVDVGVVGYLCHDSWFALYFQVAPLLSFNA